MPREEKLSKIIEKLWKQKKPPPGKSERRINSVLYGRSIHFPSSIFSTAE